MRTFPRMTQYRSHLTSRPEPNEPPYHISPFAPPWPPAAGYSSTGPEPVPGAPPTPGLAQRARAALAGLAARLRRK